MSQLGLGNAGGIGTALRTVAGQQVRSITFASQVSPTVVVDPHQQSPRTPAQAAQAGGGEALLRFIKPAMRLDTSFGPMTIAPWGEPRANYFWPIVILGGLAAAVAGGLIVRGLRRR